jgi:hypothetical protein
MSTASGIAVEALPDESTSHQLFFTSKPGGTFVSSFCLFLQNESMLMYAL